MGWFILVYLGLEGLGAFVFLDFVLFFVLVLFLFVCFVFVLLLDVVVFVFVCFFLIFCCFFCFSGGFKGQVRWPLGPPHLALNPPYFCFLVFFWLSCLCFPLRKGIFVVHSSVFPFVSLWPLLGLPLFPFLFLCFSLVFSSFFPVFISVSGSCFLFLLCLFSCFKMLFNFWFPVGCLVLF